jgi:integrase/recombinase XerD
LDFLRKEGIVAQQQECKQSTPLDRLLDQYALYLREERAVASVTVGAYSRVARELLAQKFGEGCFNLSALRAIDVITFVRHQAARGSRKTAAYVCTALRSFLGYLRYRGDVTINLSAAVPKVANWSMPSIPRSIAPGHLRQVLASCNRRSAVGSRDYAILLLLARLGLRAGARRNHQSFCRGSHGRQLVDALDPEIYSTGSPSTLLCRSIIVEQRRPATATYERGRLCHAHTT